MFRTSIVIMIAVATTAQSVAAQDLHFRRRTGHYGQLGGGTGTFELSCATGCPGELSGSAVNFGVSNHFSPRWRLDFGAYLQRNGGDVQSSLLTASLGAAVYVVGGLYVRGGGTWMAALSDSVSDIEARGGPGYLVGAGYDLFLGRTFALTPYVTYASGTLKPAGTTPGTGDITATSLAFGLNLSFIRGTWICVTASGEQIRVTRRNRVRALTCLNEVQRRFGARRGPKL